jgi:hypothetical protein
LPIISCIESAENSKTASNVTAGEENARVSFQGHAYVLNDRGDAVD